jgi:hypothetical protein
VRRGFELSGPDGVLTQPVTLSGLVSKLKENNMTLASTVLKLDPQLRDAVEAYLYLYPLAVFGVSYEALTNVEKPTWETFVR